MQIVWRCSPEQESQNEEYKKYTQTDTARPVNSCRVRFVSLIPYLGFEEIIRQLSIIKYIYI